MSTKTYFFPWMDIFFKYIQLFFIDSLLSPTSYVVTLDTFQGPEVIIDDTNSLDQVVIPTSTVEPHIFFHHTSDHDYSLPLPMFILNQPADQVSCRQQLFSPNTTGHHEDLSLLDLHDIDFVNHANINSTQLSSYNTPFKTPVNTSSTPVLEPRSTSAEQQVVDVKIRERDLTAPIIPSKEQGWSSDNSPPPNNGMPLAYSNIIKNDKVCLAITGLNTSVLSGLVTALTEDKKPSRRPTLPVEDQIVITLFRLRQNINFNIIGYLTFSPESTINGYFHKWIDIVYYTFGQIVKMPDRYNIYDRIPHHFKTEFPRLTCIIDCFEVKVESPKHLRPKAQFYSNYKKHSTIKFLISCTPYGAINFMSSAWGGRASDITIVKDAQFHTNKFHHRGDQILADRGFTLIAEFRAASGAELFVPAFRKGKPQLSASDVDETRKIAHVRIHIERVIGLLRNRYTILKGTLDLNTIKNPSDEPSTCKFDKILTVCAALVNLGLSNVKNPESGIDPTCSSGTT